MCVYFDPAPLTAMPRSRRDFTEADGACDIEHE